MLARFAWRRFASSCKKHPLPSMASGRLDTPHFKALLQTELLELESLFRSNGYDFRLVGGVVRDLLLGWKPKDVDISTNCTPERMMELLDRHKIRYIPTGLKHGTITVHMGRTDFEVTTLRVDKETDGRHAVVEFTGDWRLDALRRDLTINAMSLTTDGTLYDYFDGQKHLAEKRIVFVGDARQRITEDYLRILRYFRFYGRIVPDAARHESSTLEVIRELAPGLGKVSVERVWTELAKILTGNHAPRLAQLMYQLGVAESIGLPANGNSEELQRVWSSMKEGGYSLEPVSLLVALVHSVQEVSETVAAWKLSNREAKLGLFVAQHRAQAYIMDTPLKAYQDLLVDGYPLSLVAEVLLYCGREQLCRELQAWTVPRMPVNGHHLIEAGVPPGRSVGRQLNALLSRWKESYYTLNKQELLDIARKTLHDS